MRSNKIIIILLFTLNTVFCLNAQTGRDSLLIGTWQGTLKVESMEIPLFVKISKDNKGMLQGTMDSPSQNASDIPLTISENKDSIFVKAGTIGGTYRALVIKDSLKLQGAWSQGGKNLPLSFNKVIENDNNNEITPPVPKRDSVLFGSWQGDIDNNGTSLPLVLKFSKNKYGTLIALLDSPQQGATDIPTTRVTLEGDSVIIIANNLMAMYRGKYEKDSSLIRGIWYQIGKLFPLVLKKTDKPLTINRPQEPKEPYPYNEEFVTFQNKKAKIKLAGTLTTPKTGSKFPAVIMITGSGPQDRDENIFNHKPFKVIADYLTRLGIAVLRFDDRGVGKSEGTFEESTTKDFSTDVLAAIDFLKSRKEIDKKKIGLIGHSEGGIIAPMCAIGSKNIAYIVLLAGPGVKGDQILLEQTKLIDYAEKMDSASVKKDLELASKIYPEIQKKAEDKVISRKLEQFYSEYWNSLSDSAKAEKPFVSLLSQIRVLLSPWFKYFVSYDPSKALQKIKIPLLALNGSNDLQVSPKQNLPAIEKSLKKAGNKNYKIVEMPGLNHLFQHCKTGAPTEYAGIEETFSPDALKIMGDWILSVTK
jgi:pimeloyl-ACP methyl ester carboxylesterase